MRERNSATGQRAGNGHTVSETGSGPAVGPKKRLETEKDDLQPISPISPQATIPAVRGRNAVVPVGRAGTEVNTGLLTTSAGHSQR